MVWFSAHPACNLGVTHAGAGFAAVHLPAFLAEVVGGGISSQEQVGDKLTSV